MDKLYEVNISSNGYDCNMLVRAPNEGTALSRGILMADLNINARELTPQLLKEELADPQLINQYDLHVLNRDGIVIYDEGS